MFSIHKICYERQKKINKKSLRRKKRKALKSQQNCSQTNARGSLLNLTKVRVTTKGNGSTNMNIKKGGIIVNITMMTLI